MKKETSFALHTILGYYFLTFVFSFFSSFFEVADFSIQTLLNIVMLLIAPGLSISVISILQKIDLNFIDRKKYLSSLLVMFLMASFVLNIFKFKAVIDLVLSGRAIRSTSEIIGNLVVQVTGGVILNYVLFVLGLWVVMKLKKV